ncbi:MAG: InlB B-repeat-containing protein [Treponema sp.]|jgi:uncharacterized repeat protein (TIGR02543 family)|nr:InlB B-repeat-containing protein [Treponema sp.]
MKKKLFQIGMAALVLAFFLVVMACPPDGSVTSFTVTFDSNGGSKVSEQTVVDGEKVKKPADPTKSGFTFDAWYKDAKFEDDWDFATDTVTKDITLYANWISVDPLDGTIWEGDYKGTLFTITFNDSAFIETLSSPYFTGTIQGTWTIDGDEFTSIITSVTADPTSMLDSLPKEGDEFTGTISSTENTISMMMMMNGSPIEVTLTKVTDDEDTYTAAIFSISSSDYESVFGNGSVPTDFDLLPGGKSDLISKISNAMEKESCQELPNAVGNNLSYDTVESTVKTNKDIMEITDSEITTLMNELKSNGYGVGVNPLSDNTIGVAAAYTE